MSVGGFRASGYADLVPNLFEIESIFMLVVAFALLGVKIFALVSALLYSGEAYEVGRAS